MEIQLLGWEYPKGYSNPITRRSNNLVYVNVPSQINGLSWIETVFTGFDSPFQLGLYIPTPRVFMTCYSHVVTSGQTIGNTFFYSLIKCNSHYFLNINKNNESYLSSLNCNNGVLDNNSHSLNSSLHLHLNS